MVLMFFLEKEENLRRAYLWNSWNKAFIFWSTHHCEGFPSACLPICKNAGVVTQKGRFNYICTQVIVNLYKKHDTNAFNNSRCMQEIWCSGIVWHEIDAFLICF